MGLHNPCAHFLAHEARYRPITGRVLTLGRQTIHFGEDEFRQILDIEGFVPKSVPAGQVFDDHKFFAMLGAAQTDSMDISGYEGATIIHNLNSTIDDNLRNKSDFIYNGSTLDNVFNPISGLKNTSQLLRAGGRIIHIEHASNYTNSAYLQFSPSWFSDYYIVNNFRDVKAYIALFTTIDGAWNLFACPPDESGQIYPFQSEYPAFVVIVAEKGENSTWNAEPVQGVYRSKDMWDAFRGSLSGLAESDRPLIRPPLAVQPKGLPVNYVGLGEIGGNAPPPAKQ